MTQLRITRSARVVHPSSAGVPVDDWRERSACGPGTAHLFHVPDGGETYSDRARREAAALALCDACPVSDACLRWALATGDAWAIAGATTPEQRGYSSGCGTRLHAPVRLPAPVVRRLRDAERILRQARAGAA